MRLALSMHCTYVAARAARTHAPPGHHAQRIALSQVVTAVDRDRPNPRHPHSKHYKTTLSKCHTARLTLTPRFVTPDRLPA